MYIQFITDYQIKSNQFNLIVTYKIQPIKSHLFRCEKQNGIK